MSPTTLLLAVFLSTCMALALLLKLKQRMPLDHPNARSLHQTPTPRVGGLGVLSGLAVALLLHHPEGIWVLALPAAGLALISLFDDYLDLSARLRLLVHLLASGLFLVMAPLAVWYLAPLVFLGLVWMTNLYNFMDGADGLAGGMALFGFGAYAVLAWLAGDTGLAWFAVAVAAAALGFLVFNFPPARLFMGDAGSVPLGFLAGALGVLGWQRGLWSWTLPLLVFSPFIVDASVTLARRALRRERVWQAHRSHYYQRLVRMGWSHRRLALAEYALMAGTAASGVLSVARPGWEWGILAAWAVFYPVVMTTIDKQWRRHEHEV